MHKIALMVSNLCTLGGTERVTANLSQALSKWYECHVITLWNDGTYAYQLDPAVHLFNLYPQKRRLRAMAVDGTKRIRKYLKEQGIEVLIVVGRNNGLLPLFVGLCSSTRLIYCEHNSVSSWRFYKETLKQRVHRNLLQFLLQHVPDCVVTLTEKDLAFYKDASVRSERIYNALDDTLLAEKAVYHPEVKKLLTIARIDYQKGLEYMVEVAKRVLVKHPDWTWDVWGSGDDASYERKIERLIHENGLDGRLRFKGPSSCAYDLYDQYGVFILTSRYEGFPMVLLEAKAKKIPCVSFDIHSGPSDIIRDGVDGYLVKPFDVEQMAEKIDELIEDESLRRQFSEAAYGNLNQFREETIVPQWICLINDILKTGGVIPELERCGIGSRRVCEEMAGVLPC